MSRVLLDTLDECRRELRGLSGADIDKIYNEMPVFVACGAQSSGKSAIISRLCGFDLPQSSQLCTRVVVEIELRRSEQQVCEVYVLGHNNQEEDRRAVSADDLPAAVKELQDKIVANASSTFITDKRIVVHIEDPACANITLVDLPGLHSDKAQGVDEVRKITEAHISRPSVLALHVVKADQDYGSILGADVVTDMKTLNRLTVLTHCDRISGNPSTRIQATLDRTEKTSLHTFAVSGVPEYDDVVEKLAGLDSRLEVGFVPLAAAVERCLHVKMLEQVPKVIALLKEHLVRAEQRAENLAHVNEYKAVHKVSDSLMDAFSKMCDVFESVELRKSYELLAAQIRSYTSSSPSTGSSGSSSNAATSTVSANGQSPTTQAPFIDVEEHDFLPRSATLRRIEAFQERRGTRNSFFANRHQVVASFAKPYAEFYGAAMRNHLDLMLSNTMQNLKNNVWNTEVVPVGRHIPNKMRHVVEERCEAMRKAFDVHVDIAVEANSNPLTIFTSNEHYLHSLVSRFSSVGQKFAAVGEHPGVTETYYHICAFLKVQRKYIEEHLSKLLVLFYTKIKIEFEKVVKDDFVEYVSSVEQAPEGQRRSAEAAVVAMTRVLKKLTEVSRNGLS